MSPPLPQVHPSVVAMLAATAARVPAREALVCGAARLTYREYLACVAALAQRLAALDVRGQRVALLLPNSIQSALATFAVHAAGGVVVPLNPLYTARELEAILRDAAPRVFLHDVALAETAGPLAASCGIAHAMAVVPGADEWLDARSGPTEFPAPAPQPDDLAFVQYTGGTTGRSKGVMLTHAAVSANVSQREGLLPTGTGGERVLCVMPLFHSYALSMGLYLAAYCGGTLVILPRYRPDDVLAAFAAERITIFPGSPTIFTGLLAHAGFAAADFSRIHTCYSGSAPLPEETLRRWERATGAPIYEGYGQTEAGPVLTFNPARGVRKPASVGVPAAATEVEIVDVATGTTVLGPGQVGEIRARGPQLMRGYRNLPAETAEALRDGWLYTGDIGERDADGYLYIRDRRKDMVIVGGYNVYPREVDEVLMAHPAVLEAAAIGAPDAYRGEVVHAYVVLRPGANATADALRDHCASQLAKYKVPAAVAIVAALPKTGVGKIDRKALRGKP
jgi:long-chain acyl-CoA synthetase